MQILIKNALVLHTESDFHQQKVDIFIQNGVIENIAPKIEMLADQVIDAEGAFIAPGFVDMGVFVGDPGLEFREDFESAEKAATFGGFTTLAMQPNTIPALHSKTEVLYVKNKPNIALLIFYHWAHFLTIAKVKTLVKCTICINLVYRHLQTETRASKIVD